MAVRRLHVKWSSSRYLRGAIDGIRLRIVVDYAEGLSGKIFAYLAIPLSPVTAAQEAAFDHICSPVDMEEYPEDAPLPAVRPPWFRLNYVDVVVRDPIEAEQALTDILADIRSLKHTLDVMDTLLPGGEAWIDDRPAAPSDSSDSSDSLSGDEP